MNILSSVNKIVEENNDFLVNGINVSKTIEYYYCSVARISMCGKEGKKYEERGKKEKGLF